MRVRACHLNNHRALPYYYLPSARFPPRPFEITVDHHQPPHHTVYVLPFIQLCHCALYLHYFHSNLQISSSSFVLLNGTLWLVFCTVLFEHPLRHCPFRSQPCFAPPYWFNAYRQTSLDQHPPPYSVCSSNTRQPSSKIDTYLHFDPGRVCCAVEVIHFPSHPATDSQTLSSLPT